MLTKDSLFSQEQNLQIEGMTFNEKMRQLDIERLKEKDAEERNHNLQYAAIAIALVTFLILFLLLSRSIIVKTKFIEFFGVLGLLAVFEFKSLYSSLPGSCYKSFACVDVAGTYCYWSYASSPTS